MRGRFINKPIRTGHRGTCNMVFSERLSSSPTRSAGSESTKWRLASYQEPQIRRGYMPIGVTFRKKIRMVLGVGCNENKYLLSCFDIVQCDGQRDGQTDRTAVATSHFAAPSRCK